MPQLIAAAVAAAGLWYGYKWFLRETARVEAQLKRAERELNRRFAREVTDMRLDPETGVYQAVGE